uniref:uncharacterized protein LOC124013855 n=1 Tax=Oncorhynchus gorbuscha TaxID=8017 RepID=UPI001EAECF65|nr:uncharacterized protein LOC124013855 [Oncorhynchus gorbuscha]
MGTLINVNISKPLAHKETYTRSVVMLMVFTPSRSTMGQCGYMFSILPLPGHAELRASYFSCHTDNQDDEVFTFSFNLITIDANGVEATYSVNATCSLPIPWSPREVSCEENYMEVSMRSDISCLSGTTDAWTAGLAKAHSSAMHTWQVMFQQEGQQLIPMSFSEARELGYVFHLTQGRLVFRSPYTPRSVWSVSMINGSVVEVVHPILFSRQRWVVMMVDWIVACSTNEGMYDGAGLVWQTPTLLSPLVSGLSGLESIKISMGVDGQLLDEPITAERGYSLDISDTTVQISIPFNAAGGYRKWFHFFQSYVMDNMYQEFYVVHLYYEQIFLDDCGGETRFRLHRPMNTPLLIQHLSIINQTVLEDCVFTVYLGNLSYDVDLVAVTLNGHNFTILEANKSGLVITMVPQPNSTLHAYILRVPFEDAVVHKLMVMSLSCSHDPGSGMGSLKRPGLEVIILKFVIQMDHKPFDYLWEVGVGPYILTTNLAAKRGYIMQNDSKSLTLEVPLFSVGYSYKDINLKQFYGSFEIHSQLPKTLEVKSSLAKACLFQTTEVLVCSTEGVVTVALNPTEPFSWTPPAGLKRLMTPGLSLALDSTHVVPGSSTRVREVITALDIIKTLESDFNESAAEEDLISQEDIRFLTKMKAGIRRKDNGHYEIPLPFKEERPNLPNNKTCAVHRLKCLERRLRRNKQCYKDYTAFMEETIACGDAENVSKEEINKHPAWYIPHHGVYHPQKPGKIRVVFDCSAKF